MPRCFRLAVVLALMPNQPHRGEIAKLLVRRSARRRGIARRLMERAEAEALARDWQGRGRPPDDLVATLVAFTSRAVALACDAFLDTSRRPERLLVGGGGARNPAVLAALRTDLPGVAVETSGTRQTLPSAMVAK